MGFHCNADNMKLNSGLLQDSNLSKAASLILPLVYQITGMVQQNHFVAVNVLNSSRCLTKSNQHFRIC